MLLWASDEIVATMERLGHEALCCRRIQAFVRARLADKRDRRHEVQHLDRLRRRAEMDVVAAVTFQQLCRTRARQLLLGGLIGGT